MIPRGLKEPFMAPSQIVPIDIADPEKVVGNGYTAQISSTMSTVFVFQPNRAYKSMTCNLAFYVPPGFRFENLAPFTIRANGGISVSRLENVLSSTVNSNNVGKSIHVGGVGFLQLGTRHDITSMPCEVGHPVAYRVDSIGGLNMDFFQMSSPALGLFITVEA